MAVAVGDQVIPRSIIGDSLSDGSIPQPPLLGWVEAEAAGIITVLWDDGVRATTISAVGGTAITVCEVNAAQAATRSTYLRKYVSVSGASPEAQGLVVKTLGIELDPDGAAGTITECALVKTDAGNYFLVPVSQLTVNANR
jgi:hypothetical protein